jgi:hypothetical protein
MLAGHLAGMDGMNFLPHYDRTYKGRVFLGIRRPRWEDIIERNLKK